MELNVEKFEKELQNNFGEIYVNFNYYKDTDITATIFDNSDFILSMWIENDELVIGNIDSFQNETGLKLIDIIINFCKLENIKSIRANKVKSETIGFWEKVNFKNLNNENFQYIL
jgi:hypothetical protein